MRLISFRNPALALLFGTAPMLSLALESGAQAENPAGVRWSGFQNGGELTTPAALPLNWTSQGESIAWQAALTGYGQSSPVVFNATVYVTSTSGPNKEKYHLACLDLATGEKRWQQVFDNPTPEENNSYVSRSAPTPIVDEHGVIAFYEGGVVVALSNDGQIRWQRNLVEEFGPIKARHGLASSLEQHGDLAFVWIERGEDPYVMAVRKETGETVWKAAGLGSTTWSSPRVMAVGDEAHLVCSSSGRIVGFSPETGDRLWEFTDLANNTSCTPIPAGNGRFVIGASDGRGEEGAGNAAKSNGLVAIRKNGEGSFQADWVWQADKATCSFASPIVTSDSVWIINRAGVLYRLDLETGKQLSTNRVKAGSAWATPLTAEDRLYIFGQKGTTSVLSMVDEKELAVNELWAATDQPAATGSPVLYAAAVASPYLLIRRGDTLFALRQAP